MENKTYVIVRGTIVSHVLEWPLKPFIPCVKGIFFKKKGEKIVIKHTSQFLFFLQVVKVSVLWIVMR